MNFSDNKYFYEIMSKCFLILIEMNLYQYRFNRIFLNEHNDDKSLGIYEAMKDLAELGESVICVNFDPDFPVQKIENLSFVGQSTLYNAPIPCDFLFLFSKMDVKVITDICDHYCPKFIFHC